MQTSIHPKQKEIIETLSHIFQTEMTGVSRYLHYSFMIMGHNRIPIQKWLRDQAQEALTHATQVGEKITAYGGHPPLFNNPVTESNVHTVDQILKESLEFEIEGLNLYRKLALAAGDDMALEEFARGFVLDETEHVEEVKKMLRPSE